MSDTRGQIGDALAGKLTPDQITLLLDEVLAIKKQAWGEFACKNCGQRQRQSTEITDAKAVTQALVDLVNQAWGRPQDDRPEDEQIVFTRVVNYRGDADA